MSVAAWAGGGATPRAELAHLVPKRRGMLAVPQTVEEAVGLLRGNTAVFDSGTQLRSRMPDTHAADDLVDLIRLVSRAHALGLGVGQPTGLGHLVGALQETLAPPIAGVGAQALVHTQSVRDTTSGSLYSVQVPAKQQLIERNHRQQQEVTETLSSFMAWPGVATGYAQRLPGEHPAQYFRRQSAGRRHRAAGHRPWVMFPMVSAGPCPTLGPGHPLHSGTVGHQPGLRAARPHGRHLPGQARERTGRPADDDAVGGRAHEPDRVEKDVEPGGGEAKTALVPHQATFARIEMARSSLLSVCRLRQAM